MMNSNFCEGQNDKLNLFSEAAFTIAQKKNIASTPQNFAARIYIMEKNVRI